MEEITQGGGGGSSTLAGLNDVNISSPTDGQALVFDNATQKWVNGAGGGGSSTFAGLNDVNVQGVQNGDIARYNSATGKWTDSSDLSDLELTVAQLQASVLSITDGHDILDSNGTVMAQEDGLQFASGCVEDDPVNGKTIYIEMIRISQANYNTLKANGQLKPGAKYFIYDAQPVAVNASNLPYSSTQSTKQKIDGLDASTLPYSNNLSIREKIGLINQHGVNWNGAMEITLDATKFYQFSGGRGNSYSNCFIYYDSSWLILGQNDAGITIANNVLTIPRYTRWLMTSF
jgi:hypothetical protein